MPAGLGSVIKDLIERGVKVGGKVLAEDAVKSGSKIVSEEAAKKLTEASALPTNVLANHVLELSEKQQMDLQTRVELGLDEQRDQGQSQSVGMKR